MCEYFMLASQAQFGGFLTSYLVCVAHIQNNALLYFFDIIQCMHMTVCGCKVDTENFCGFSSHSRSSHSQEFTNHSAHGFL